jgi:DNA-binding MarR family transcriptional regulator/N-acetylglutamate synthase-like GNAT family acetyltransferase
MSEEFLMKNTSAVRKFNRFYTQKIGALDRGHLESPFSLTDIRVMYEITNGKDVTASDVGKILDLDAGYLSRILGNFKKQGLVSSKRSDTDARQYHLLLTKKGERTFSELNERTNQTVNSMLKKLSDEDRKNLVGAMQKIERIIGNEPRENRVPYIIRNHQPGDIGWVTYRHGILYSQEYGWDESFEALVAEIAAEFIQKFDPKRERCWIAEREGEIVGSVFLVKKTDTVAKLRLLLVEPSARGLGIGGRLVSECTRFARQAGYKKIALWTQSNLNSARKIYQAEGYKLVKEESHHSFGHDLVAETWELKL